MMKSYKVFLLLASALMTFSCGKNKENVENLQPESENLIEISLDQFTAGNMILGNSIEREFRKVVQCNGRIVVQPSGLANVSSPLPGIVKRIECTEGQKVSAGQTLFILTGSEFIETQKDLAESSSYLKRIRSDYERVKGLYKENVGSEKEMILAESEYLAANAKYVSLKMKIRMLGLDEKRIEEGDFYDSFSIKAPIKGNLTSLMVAQGQYADPQAALAQVIDISKIHLRLEIFEKDHSGLKEGQVVTFHLIGEPQKSFTARLKTIGKTVDNESRTILCYAMIDDQDNEVFVNNAFAQASVVTDSDTVWSVPEESLLKSGSEYFILELAGKDDKAYYLRKIKANIGRIEEGYAEILNQEKTGEIIIQGAYNIRLE